MQTKKRGFTLLELIMVIVIISFLSTATFKALKTILIRSYKAKEITKLSIELQIVTNQISNYLHTRIPATTIGYDGSDFEYIGDLTSSKPILEWISFDNNKLLSGDYSGFLDMNNSDYSSNTIDIDNNNLSSTQYIIFAGSFDRGSSDLNDYNNSFGWHGNNHNNIFKLINIDSDGNATIDSTQPKFIYEKYFILKSAYTIARGADIDQSATCIDNLNISNKDINDTLFLFYDYKPWDGETFCSDSNGNPGGSVAILMQNVQGFRFEEIDHTIRLSIDVNKSIKGSSSPIHISKMKVVL
jgi:prepilin-type N-terminal cleavage/methylation domain-containing protein